MSRRPNAIDRTLMSAGILLGGILFLAGATRLRKRPRGLQPEDMPLGGERSIRTTLPWGMTNYQA